VAEQDDSGSTKRRKKITNGSKQGETPEEEDARLEQEASACPHEVIVIPIVWRGRHDSQQLLDVADRVKRALAQQGVDTWIDSRRQYTPGQKFAYWEHKGAKYRIEIGPKDFEKGQLCVCKHPDIPGDYLKTEKRHVALPPDGIRDLMVELKKFGLEKLSIVVPENETRDLSVMEKVEKEKNGKRVKTGGSQEDQPKKSRDTLEENFELISDKKQSKKMENTDGKKRRK